MAFSIKELQEDLAKVRSLIMKQGETISVLNDLETLQNKIKELRSKSEKDEFTVLMMGQFSSGKSSALNVLLEEKILPTKALPATALITEIRYGVQRRVTVFPRKGKWSGGDQPFDVPPEKLREYILINNLENGNTKDGNTIESPFEKIAVQWPLKILEDGVVIVDSPGLNDPYSHDIITTEYAQQADAVIFCMNASRAYDHVDVDALELLGAIGLKSPMFLITYFDVIQAEATKSELEEFITVTRRNCLKHTTLNKDCIHFVDSLRALRAKESGAHSELVASGYYEFEQYISSFLVNHKGRAKIETRTSQMAAIRRDAEKYIESSLKTIDKAPEDIKQRLEKARSDYDAAKQRGDNLVTSANLYLGEGSQYSFAIKRAAEELADNLPAKLEEDGLEGFVPTANFSMIHPKKSSEKIASETLEELARRAKTMVGRWGNDTLLPLVKEQLANVGKLLAKDESAFSDSLEDAHISLTDTPSVPDSSGSASRVGAVIYGMLTGDVFGAIDMGINGFGAIGRQLLAGVIAGIVIYIAALFNPVTGPFTAAVLLIAQIGAVFVGAKTRDKAIIKKCAKKFREEYTKPEMKQKVVQSIMDQINKSVTMKVKNAITDSVAEDLSSLDETIKSIQKDFQKSSQDREAKRQALLDIQKQLAEIEEEAQTLRTKYKIV